MASVGSKIMLKNYFQVTVSLLCSTIGLTAQQSVFEKQLSHLFIVAGLNDITVHFAGTFRTSYELFCKASVVIALYRHCFGSMTDYFLS